MAAYPFTSIESPSARYFPFDVCLEMAAVASAVNYRVVDSKRLALQPHRFRFDIDRRASIDAFSRFVFFCDRICNNRNEITPSLLAGGKKIDRIVRPRRLLMIYAPLCRCVIILILAFQVRYFILNFPVQWRYDHNIVNFFEKKIPMRFINNIKSNLLEKRVKFKLSRLLYV